VIHSLPSWVHRRSTGPSFDALQACVPLSISLHVHIVPNVLPRSLCGWPRTSLHLLEEGHNHPIVRFAYLCHGHMIGEELVFFSLLYIKFFELGVEVALNHRSAVTHHKVICSNSHSGAAALSALMMLLCCSFASASTTSRNPSSLYVDHLNSTIYPICRALLIATPSGLLPQKRFTKKDSGSSLYSAS